jgi:YD repeat-containing protein
MKLKIISSCLLFITLFFSCKKEDLSNGLETGNKPDYSVPLLSKVLIDNQAAYEYVYNDSSQLVAENSKFNFNINQYNALGQLASTDYYGNDAILSSDAQVVQAALSSTIWVCSTTGVKGGTLSYNYNDKGQLIKTSYSRPVTTSSEYSEFTYNANGKISRQTMYWADAATGYIDYTYDSKGNMVKEALYNLPSSGAAELITTTQYEFDSKLNPYKLAGKILIPGENTNPNNIIKETYTIHINPDQGPDNVLVTQTTYTYNNLGYPVTENGNTTFIYK